MKLYVKVLLAVLVCVGCLGVIGLVASAAISFAMFGAVAVDRNTQESQLKKEYRLTNCNAEGLRLLVAAAKDHLSEYSSETDGGVPSKFGVSKAE